MNAILKLKWLMTHWHCGFFNRGNCWRFRFSKSKFHTCTFYEFWRFFVSIDRKMVSLIALLALATSAFAQTNTNNVIPPPPVQAFNAALTFIASSSNLMIAPYGIYSSGTHGGGAGLALAYRINDYVAPVLRFETLNHQFYQGSFSTQVGLPITIASNWTIVPFGLGGLALPIGGAGGKDGTIQGIAGIGVALRLDFLGAFGKHLDLITDWEKWSTIPGDQYRFGFMYKF